MTVTVNWLELAEATINVAVKVTSCVFVTVHVAVPEHTLGVDVQPWNSYPVAGVTVKLIEVPWLYTFEALKEEVLVCNKLSEETTVPLPTCTKLNVRVI